MTPPAPAFAIADIKDRPITPAQLGDLFARSGIRRPTTDLPRLTKMLEYANLISGAWQNDLLIGVARALTDFSFCCYLSDLAVDKNHQRQGIGRALITHIRSQLTGDVTLLLLSAPEAMDYYPHLGFEPANNAWRIPRTK
jgi:GNAT superfamily N-acetyltransferase